MSNYLPKHGAIAAGDELTAMAGYKILKAGGNAFDGAIAATLMSFVASSTITSMGGGGFMLCRDSAGKVSFLEFFVQTPKHKRDQRSINFFPVNVDFGDKRQEFHVGLGTAATPGNLAGLFDIHKQFGTLPFRALTPPAIEAARNGIRFHNQTKYQANILKSILSLSRTGKEIYFTDFEMDPDACVNAPRIHYENGQLDIEPGYENEIIENLDLPGTEIIYWTEKNMYFGGVHSVFSDKHNELIAAGDRRRVGATRML